jgi:hypothetical protein
MNVRELVVVARGPLATAYCCPYCRFTAVVRKGFPGGLGGGGRGSGFRNGSINHAAVVNHIKAEHQEQLKTLRGHKSP